MKILLGLGAIIVAVVVFFTLRSPAKAPVLLPSSSNFTVAVLHGTVFLKNSGSADFKEITGSVTVGEASEIKTSATGQANLLYPNGTITLIDENSDIILKTLSGQGEHSTIQLVTGSVWSKIKNILGIGEFYQVQTNNVVASVRGTIFGTRFINSATTVFGIEHTVTVGAINGQGNLISGTNTQLPAGNKIMLATNHLQSGLLSTEPITDSDLRDPAMQRALKLLIDAGALTDPGTKILMDRFAELVSPSPTPTVTPKTTPTPTPKITLTPTPTLKPSNTPIPTATPSPTPTPNQDVTFDSVFPQSVASGAEFTLNGSNFTIGRNTRQVSAVLLNNINVQFSLVDAQTIFVTATQPAGTYDVSVVTTVGTTLTLKGAITIK